MITETPKRIVKVNCEKCGKRIIDFEIKPKGKKDDKIDVVKISAFWEQLFKEHGGVWTQRILQKDYRGYIKLQEFFHFFHHDCLEEKYKEFKEKSKLGMSQETLLKKILI